MLRLKLVKETDSKVVYNYYPEQGNESGTITLDKSKGEIINVIISNNDSHERYMYHAVSKIMGFFQKGVYSEEEIVAWY